MKKFMAATIVAGTSVLSLGIMLPAMASEAPHSITSGDGASAVSVDAGNLVNTENSRGGIQVKSVDDRDNRGAGVTLDGLFNRNGSGRGITAVTTDRDGASTFGLDLANVVDTQNSRGGVYAKSEDGRDHRGAGVTLDGLFNRSGSGRGITAVTTDRDRTSTFGLNLGDVLGR